MFLPFLASLLLFALLGVGLAWPLVARLALPAPEKLLAAVVLSLVLLYGAAWAVFVGRLPLAALWILPPLAVAGLGWRRRELRELAADDTCRALLLGQALVSLWCIGWLATIATYSGGGWAGDWFEHWERARFFLERWPLEAKFIAQYALTARPPLANVVTGAWLCLTRIDFPHYQLFSTLFASLAFLPAALLARRWGGVRAVALLAVLVMVNPLFVQNATFAWTKLPAAFFVLAGLHFFLRAHETSPPPLAAAWCGTSLAAGALAHYSAGPYIVMLASGWLAFGWRRRTDPAWWRSSGGAALSATLLLATWFGWSLAVYGVDGTFLTNSTVTSSDARSGNQWAKIALNLRDTIVPHFLRSLDTSLIAQTSPWGGWRDWFFQSYQLNLPLALGSLAWLAVAREAWRTAKSARRSIAAAWIVFVGGVVVLGTASHGQRDHWGLTHICLQALVILGLAFLAARWRGLGRGWRLALIAGATVDFAGGIALQFGVQSFAFERWLAPGRSADDMFATLSLPARMNLAGRIKNQVEFLSDALAVPPAGIACGLALLLGLALWRTRATGAPPRVSE
jgi:4-amino-4-deoxy-L-arabinose transferase-like glycosyltransferase